MPTILQNHYVLAVHDVNASAKFYADALGFVITAEPPGWIFVSKDNPPIMLGECPDDLPPSELGSHNYFAYLHSRRCRRDICGASGGRACRR